MIAAWLRWTDRVDEVWFVPAFEHAFGKDLAPWPQRLRAVEALAALVDARVSAIEATLPRPSYTIRTLEALQAQHSEHRFRLVIGADVQAQLPLWRSHERIVAEFEPIVVGRMGYDPVSGAPVFPAVSSTEIRARLAQGQPIDGLVPRAVLDAWGYPSTGASSPS